MVEPLNMVFLFTVLFILKFTLTVGIEKNYETMPFMFSDTNVANQLCKIVLSTRNTKFSFFCTNYHLQFFDHKPGRFP